MRGKVGDKLISKSDREILTEANKIRIDLERYSSRAFFDNRNLEDILSLLSFEALAEGNNTKYETMVKAVGLTIELSCAYQYLESVPEKPTRGTRYESFWSAFLNPEIQYARPALITFNYDLVFERTLYEYFNFVRGTRPENAVKSVGIRYHRGIYDFNVSSEPHQYNYGNPGNFDLKIGEKARIDWNENADVKISYLKLHGSLNWHQDHSENPTNEKGERIFPNNYPTQVVEKPFISSRINFNPASHNPSGSDPNDGRFSHFVHNLRHKPRDLLFFP